MTKLVYFTCYLGNFNRYKQTVESELPLGVYKKQPRKWKLDEGGGYGGCKQPCGTCSWLYTDGFRDQRGLNQHVREAVKDGVKNLNISRK